MGDDRWWEEAGALDFLQDGSADEFVPLCAWPGPRRIVVARLRRPPSPFFHSGLNRFFFVLREGPLDLYRARVQERDGAPVVEMVERGNRFENKGRLLGMLQWFLLASNGGQAPAMSGDVLLTFVEASPKLVEGVLLGPGEGSDLFVMLGERCPAWVEEVRWREEVAWR